MKKIFRMLVFSAVAIYLTSLWNAGFKVDFQPDIFIPTVLLVALFYYLVIPISKIILLPINLLTLGLLTSIIYLLLFYFFITKFSYVVIKPWDFPGLHFYMVNIGSYHINYFFNIALSSLSLSIIINLLEALI